MAETNIWSGTSSQLKNARVFAMAIIWLIAAAVILFLTYGWAEASYILILLGVVTIIVLIFVVERWLAVNARRYQLTSERLLITDGILTKTTDSLELYRVKDIRKTQPFLLRMFGLENIELNTSDTTTPRVVVDYVPATIGLSDQARNAVEACRVAKGTREVELE